MQKSRVYINYNKWSDNALATLAGRAASFMTDNEAFPTPPIDMVSYTALAENFRMTLQEAIENGGKLAVTAKNNARKVLLDAMRQLAFYVNTVADGDEHKLASSGLVQVLTPQSLKRPFPPLLVRLRDGNQTGELNLMFEHVANAWEYEYTIAHETDEQGQPRWEAIESTTNSFGITLASLTEGVRYYARVRSRNGKGVSAWSPTVSRLAN